MVLTATKEASVQIEVKGRHTEITDEIRQHVEKRFARVARQVPESAELEVELSEEKNPAIADRYIAEATLWAKGATLRAHEASPKMLHSIHEIAEDIRRQVKRHSELQRKRSQTRRLVARLRGRAA